MENQPRKTIKSIYFYLVSFVALMMVVFSSADMINIALRTWVFTAADKDTYAYPRAVCEVPAPATPTEPKAVPAPTKEECEKQNKEYTQQQEASRIAQKQRDVVRDISMILVGIPLFLIHWKILRSKEENL
mgnify:CR=1 FL=1